MESQGTFDSRIGRYRMNFSKTKMLGVSDIIACLDGGRFVAIEVKNKQGRLSEHQAVFLRRVSELGGLAIVARSVEDVHEFLNKVFRSKDDTK